MGKIDFPENATRLIVLFCLSLSLMTLGSCSTGITHNSRNILASSEVGTPLKDSSLVDSSQPNTRGPTSRFEWPVDDARFIRGFMPNKRRPHLGLDLAARRGTPIYSSQSGMVLYAGKAFRGYGKMVLVESGHGWATVYAHLDKILVDEGQMVTTEDVLGLMGRTGRATGVHLHFEIRRDKGPVDPLNYLPGGSRIAGHI